jgi:D-sedoheptulose 7-phosphate isomerase
MDIDQIHSYLTRLHQAANQERGLVVVPRLAEAILDAWSTGKCIYICGNGGSAGNAIHLANDLIYGAGMTNGRGLRAEALSANAAVLTCLANDTGYENIYSEQLRVKGAEGDILIALSGSGNSPNIVRAIETAKDIGMKTFAILGYSGGKCKEIADHPIHFEVDDMQIAEDLQLIVGHICMQWLSEQKI